MTACRKIQALGNVTRTGMSPGTLYHVRGWAANASEGTVWSAEERVIVTEPLQGRIKCLEVRSAHL